MTKGGAVKSPSTLALHAYPSDRGCGIAAEGWCRKLARSWERESVEEAGMEGDDERQAWPKWVARLLGAVQQEAVFRAAADMAAERRPSLPALLAGTSFPPASCVVDQPSPVLCFRLQGQGVLHSHASRAAWIYLCAEAGQGFVGIGKAGSANECAADGVRKCACSGCEAHSLSHLGCLDCGEVYVAGFWWGRTRRMVERGRVWPP